ncbi:hypothetical protein Plhal710r2_c037g0132221 [Plasmopara halstedii]
MHGDNLSFATLEFIILMFSKGPIFLVANFSLLFSISLATCLREILRVSQGI